MKFVSSDLDKHKRFERRLLCLDCKTKEDAIIKKINQKGAWLCKCGAGATSGMHAEKCPLFPTQAGERRWPGKNKAVQQWEWEFLQRVNKKYKSK